MISAKRRLKQAIAGIMSLLAVSVTAATANAAPAAAPAAGAAQTPATPGAETATPPAARDDAPPQTAPTPPASVAQPGAGAATETDAAATLERALAAYEYGDMDQVVESARTVAEGRAHPNPTQRIQALRLLGIGLFLTGRPEGAETAFFDLLRQKPGARLDPTHTRPDVVAFFESVRTRHSDEIREAARNRPGGKHLAWAFLPPAGQFQNGDRARGIVFGALEVVSLGLAIGTYAQLTKWRNPADDTFGTHASDAQTLRIVNNVSVGVFAATLVVGILDGIVNFSPHDEEPPLAWLGPGGLTLRF
jgi:hypothetical protein